jgi:Txe/YoeB family toxin of Txe-Axe toxin-antitoxin module
VVLQAYIDASGMGSIEKDPHLVLAGFLSTSEVWAEFSDAWKNELDKAPGLDYFKLNEAFVPNRESQFYGWKQEDISDKINKLIKIIRSYPFRRVCTYIDKREFDKLTIKQPDKRRIDNPYWLGFIYIVVEIIKYQIKNNVEVPIDFIFDYEEKLGDDCVKWLNYFRKYYFPKWVSPYFDSPPMFKNDKTFNPLQAADLYAGFYRRWKFENKIIFMPMTKELRSLQTIRGFARRLNLNILSMWMQMNNDEIIQLMERAREIVP